MMPDGSLAIVQSLPVYASKRLTMEATAMNMPAFGFKTIKP
jgi:hypothetical protein